MPSAPQNASPSGSENAPAVGADSGAGLPARLGEALAAAGYHHDRVAGLIGPVAHAALARNETTPAARRTAGAAEPLAVLTRLFLLQRPVSVADAERALPGLVADLSAAGFLSRRGDEVTALLDVRPYAADGHDLWVASDLTPGLDGAPVRVDADHVLGVSGSAVSLAQLTQREPVRRALDLGTGCGVQALHLAGHADRVVATDVNPRALRLARFNAALNAAPHVEVREGSLFAPVAGERFELVVSNPPFVISPATADRLVYRDSGLPGDRVVEEIVRAAPRHLADDGWCQVLASWAVVRDRPWDERLAGWLDGSCDALVVQRELLDPAAYVEVWLRDAGAHQAPGYLRRYDDWLGWFEQQRVEGVGFGWVNLRQRAAPGPPAVTFLDWPHPVEQPVAPAIGAWGRAVRLDVTPESRLVTRPDVRQETDGRPGAEDPETIVLRQQRGLRRARRADTVEAGLVGACDGELALGQILDALALLLDREPGELRAAYLPVARQLVTEGYLDVLE